MLSQVFVWWKWIREHSVNLDLSVEMQVLVTRPFWKRVELKSKKMQSMFNKTNYNSYCRKKCTSSFDETNYNNFYRRKECNQSNLPNSAFTF
jgi:hypothetical protein